MKQLVSYITCSLLGADFSVDAVLALKEAGVDKIELGVPFSDPVADGPVIEKANLKALKEGFKLDQLFDVSQKVGNEIDTYWMGYFNNFYHKGYDLMIKKAKESGVKGFILPDLPFGETMPYKDKHPLISFVAPTDSKERVQTILKEAKEFVYLVAYAGITGSEKKEDLRGVITAIRETTDTNLFIGFGVNEKTAKEKAQGVDGVIVGSAYIKIMMDETLTNSEKIDRMVSLSKILKEEINS